MSLYRVTQGLKLIKHTDINECTEGTDNCQQTCTNTDGSFTCDCDTGFRLATDGHNCNGQSVLSHTGELTLWHNPVPNTYTDINECAEDTHNCAQECTNTIGSFTCDCNTGYRLASDGHSCNGNYHTIFS